MAVKLSTEDYRRGLLHWDIPDAVLCVTSAASPDDRDEWSEAIAYISGAVAPVPRRQVTRIRVVPRGGPGSTRPPYQIRWESLDLSDAHITTRVWEDLAAPPRVLPFVPNFGTFHRLVVATPLLAWPEEAILRAGDIVVRLVDGPIVGEQIGGVESVAISATHVQTETEQMGTVRVVGRFVEFTAPGSTPEHAEHAAFALLGYLAVCLGDHAVGEVVFSESYEAGADGVQMSVPVPTVGLAPWPVEAESVGALDQGFPAVAAAVAEEHALAIALRWYEQGVRVRAPLDKLLAFYVGVEAIVTEYGARNGPLPVTEQRREQHGPLLEDLAARVPPDTLNSIKSRLIEPSIMDRFRFYVERRRLDEGLVGTFRKLRDLRNDVFHGAAVVVDIDHAADARRLLGTLVRTELGVPADLPWERSSRILEARVNYTSWHRRG